MYSSCVAIFPPAHLHRRTELAKLGELHRICLVFFFYGQGNPDSPQVMTHFDPALQLPDDFEAQVQMEVGILKGPHVKWVWNRRFIRENAFLDIRRTACSVLKGLVTGPFEYLVTDVTPANFETKLRQLVVGHIQNAAQQANELNCEIIGCSEGADLGF